MEQPYIINNEKFINGIKYSAELYPVENTRHMKCRAEVKFPLTAITMLEAIQFYELRERSALCRTESEPINDEIDEVYFVCEFIFFWNKATSGIMEELFSHLERIAHELSSIEYVSNLETGHTDPDWYVIQLINSLLDFCE